MAGAREVSQSRGFFFVPDASGRTHTVRLRSGSSSRKHLIIHRAMCSPGGTSLAVRSSSWQPLQVVTAL